MNQQLVWRTCCAALLALGLQAGAFHARAQIPAPPQAESPGSPQQPAGDGAALQPTAQQSAKTLRDQAEQHDRLERAALEKRTAAEQAACYQRFAVNDCLRGVLQRSRAEGAVLDKRQQARNQEERQERAARQKAAQQEQAQSQQGAFLPRPGASASPAATAPGHRPLVAPKPVAPRTPEVRKPKAPTPRAAPAPKASAAERDAAAAQARDRLLERQQEAARRREAHAREQAERDAKGHPRPLPLPPLGPPASP